MAPAYIVDQTPLRKIQYDLLKARDVGADAVLGFLKVGSGGGFVSIIAGGLHGGWKPRKSPNPADTLIKFFDVLLLPPVTVELCDDVVALQMNGHVFEKIGQTPWTGETPAQWIFETKFTGHNVIVL